MQSQDTSLELYVWLSIRITILEDHLQSDGMTAFIRTASRSINEKLTGHGTASEVMHGTASRRILAHLDDLLCTIA